MNERMNEFATTVVLLMVPKEDRRRFMLMAHELGMTKGDYGGHNIT